jgi:CheY-like chemotaxis protein
MKTISVLVVDDHHSLRRNLVAMLEDEGFVVHGVGSGEEGLQALKTFPADLALVDMRLPGMDGNEFILAAHAANAALNFIVLTGSVDYVLPDELCRIGLSDQAVFMKPLADPAAFIGYLHAQVGKRRE